MKINPFLFFRGLLLTMAVLPLVNCATSGPGGASFAPPPMQPSAEAEYQAGSVTASRISRDSGSPTDAIISSPSKPKVARPGLATQAGDEMSSSLANVPFYRKTTGQPDAVDSFHYNDETGAKAMAEAVGGARKRSGAFSVAGGRLEVALRPGWGSPYERYETDTKRIVIGSPGSNYKIALTNRTKHAVEVVASVDSLDVMDGRTASVKKRGYIIPAKGELAIDGFRVNADTVKRFVFGSVDQSAAAKAGVSRNVGVIGLAVYDEDEAQAKLARLIEAQKRGAADPFAVSTR